MKSPEYENDYDNKFHIFEELKMEVLNTEDPHSDCNVNNEIVSEDKELSNFNGKNIIKHEDMEKGLPLNVTIKTESIVEEEILDKNKNMSVPYKLNVQDVQLNSDEKLLKDNVGLSKPKNEQTNMARVEELNELHKCKHCDIYFDHRDDMLVHISLIHNNKTLKCEVCGKKLTNLSHLKRHITLVHKHKEPPKVAEIIFKCINCKAEFNNRLTLNDHVKQYCSPEYLSKHIIQCHVNTNKEELTCKSCSAVFITKQNLIRHMKNIHNDYGRTFDCWCGKQFRSPDYLRFHKQRQHERTDNGMFQCDNCQKIFKSKVSLVKHIKSLHYDYGRTFDCWCGKQFRSPYYLSYHKKRHEHKINDRVQCDKCQFFFKNKQCLYRHIMRVHYDYGRTFDCWCGKLFRSPAYLRQHKWRRHERTDNGSFQCESCQRSFKKKHSLFIHVKRFHYDYESTSDC